MAMNKKEQAEMQALQSMVASLQLLTGGPVEPPPPAMTREEIRDACKATGQEPLPGWFVNDYVILELGTRWRGDVLERAITLGCSNGFSHNPQGPRTSSQEMGRMWRTQHEALLYARFLCITRCGEHLAAIDVLLKAATPLK